MIHVFSATGNSLQLAEELSLRTGQRIVRITENGTDTDTDSTVFIVCPIYYYEIPEIVKEYVRRMEISKTQKTVLIVNYGTTPGNAVKRAVRFFGEHGIELKHVFGFAMPENYIPLFDPPEQAAIDRMTEAVPGHILRVLAHLDDDCYIEKCAGFFAPAVSLIGHAAYNPFRKTKKFAADGNCTSCGLCESICPRHVIELKDGRPVWTEPRCEHCMACINRCPSSAIQFGRTQKRKRYVNPKSNL